MYSTTLRSTYFTEATCVVQQRECQDWPKNQTAYWTIALTGLFIVQQTSVAGGQYLLNQPLVLCVMHWKIHKNTPWRDYVWLMQWYLGIFIHFRQGNMLTWHSPIQLQTWNMQVVLYFFFYDRLYWDIWYLLKVKHFSFWFS